MWQHSGRIGRALKRLRKEQYQQLLIRHTCQKEVGSYNCTPDQLHALILGSEWAAYGCPNLLPEFAYFRAELPGLWGYLDIAHKTNGHMLFLLRAHGSENWELHTNANAQMCDFTVMTLGKDGEREVLIDFHPGDPMKPVVISHASLAAMSAGVELIRTREETENGYKIQVTAQQALELGLRWAKTQ